MTENIITPDIPNVFAPLYTDNESDIFVITGGRYSAKTHNAAFWIPVQMQSSRYFRCIATRYNFGSIQDSIKAAIEEQIEKLNWGQYFNITRNRICCRNNDNIIIFKGLKKSELSQQKGKGYQGFNKLLIEEAQEWTDEEAFFEWFRSFRVKQEGTHNQTYLLLNPTHREHWIHKRFFLPNRIPEGYNGIDYSDLYVRYIHSTYRVCERYLPENILRELESLRIRDPRLFNNIVEGGWLDNDERALFKWDWINRNRIDRIHVELRETVVVIDPAAEGDESKDHDKHGILVGAIDNNDIMYIIADETCHGTPKDAAYKAINLYEKYKASCIVAEDNNGGKWIPTVFNQINRFVDVRCVKASQGKMARMQPAAAYCERDMIKFVGTFAELEGQLCSYCAAPGQKSPNNYDCLAWLYHYFSGKYGARLETGFARGLV